MARRKTHEEYVEQIASIFGKGEYTSLTRYETNNTVVTFQHNNEECGNHVFSIKAVSSTNKRKTNILCPVCNKKYNAQQMMVSNDDFLKEINHIKDYIPLEKVKGRHTPILFRHLSDECNNHEWRITPSNFLAKGKRCPKCAGNAKYTENKIKNKVLKMTKGEYEITGNFTNVDTNTVFKHNSVECDYHQWEAKPNNFFSGTRCPVCKNKGKSKGEKKIWDFLISKNIKNIYQFKEHNCRLKRKLPFDFAIMFNNKLLAIIEYDGIQHFKPVKHWGGKEGFKNRQHSDQTKNQYCKDNGIPLIRIPYWDFDNIETILEKELTALGIIREESIESILV